jgi:hypothetical protein
MIYKSSIIIAGYQKLKNRNERFVQTNTICLISVFKLALKYCKNYCQEPKSKVKYHIMKSLGRFSLDYGFQSHKRCSVCEVFMIFDGLLCPCCRNRFRLHPRNKKIS